ncbi:pyridoxamine 5'-phosphate oxidase family protein [Pseudonocardia charpentierae]|uniref:Pyridoxamine 5'-phosphate oxidase family protein n=1 Tax=Pseudonocardia charpentierae TaxID=3075545 RepID=A0ABU2NK73_9PSEU|nr:pyridoxamine 5'-phosphate oxidase family protein [Pseudonocardia sp. DSM 45834]MDT0353393.1 pyridoxamine 5'-phosphate oxidase family protein [Pseudonocardia sp. DSM 45834]
MAEQRPPQLPPRFDDIAEEFLRIVADTVICTTSTVDRRGRPRSRMLHPVFTVNAGQPVGWALTSRASAKARDLAQQPYACCSYWNPHQDVAIVDCRTAWVTDEAEKATVWDLFRDTPTPLGWGPEAMTAYGTSRWHNPLFTPLRLDPWRIRIVAGTEYPRGDLAGQVWQRSATP